MSQRDPMSGGPFWEWFDDNDPTGCLGFIVGSIVFGLAATVIWFVIGVLLGGL